MVTGVLLAVGWAMALGAFVLPPAKERLTSAKQAKNPIFSKLFKT